jgi:hypothetical protein
MSTTPACVIVKRNNKWLLNLAGKLVIFEHLLVLRRGLDP